ncbi:OmpA family protein [Alphaproteobacteria bacterium]|nr:OmpA family protein [Alphaproteobacteria bacterium]
MSYYSKTKSSEENSIIWPGFVDVLASTLMVIIFVVLLFTVAQVYLGDLVVGKNEQIQNLEKTIEIQDETIVEQDLSLSDKELALIERQEVISQLDTELEILDQEIRAKLSEISEKESLITAKDEEIIEKESLITSKDQEILIQDELLKQKDETILTLDDLIDKQSLDIAELNEIIARITEELSLSLDEKEELRGKLSSLNEEQESLKNQLQALGGENQLLVGQLSDSQGRIQSLLESLSSSKGENEILETQISSVENQNQSLRDQISSLEQDSTIQTTNLNEALAQISRLSEDIKILSNEIQLLNNLLDAKEAEIASNKIELGELGDRLNRVLTSELFKLQKYKSEFFGQLSETLGQREDIQIKGDRFIFQSEILFESGSADIQAEGSVALSLIAKTLIDLSDQIPTDLNWVLQIDGHTDRIPIATAKFPSNWELSHARALEVVKFFIQQGIPADKLSANGYGEHQPISLGSSPEDLKLNRRIELKITQR